MACIRLMVIISGQINTYFVNYDGMNVKHRERETSRMIPMFFSLSTYVNDGAIS